MITTAQKFWLETPLNAVSLLMDQTVSYAEENEDLADMYNEDWKDFSAAITLFRNSDCEGLANHIIEMDTAPREQLIVAFAEDCGKNFVSQNLGWELR
jgi:hypothetical protein